MNSILRIHKKVLDYLLKIREKDPLFMFVPRKINNKNRLDEGYWFIGNEHYLQLSFWNGTDWKEKINNIGFSIDSKGGSWIDLSAQDSDAKALFLKDVSENLGGFTKDGSKNRWYRQYSGTDYLANLNSFIETIKPLIDDLLKREKPNGISFLDKSFEKKIVKVSTLRANQIIHGEKNKISRIVWNTNNWKKPSGLTGAPKSDFKADHGYGHEEWLFDKSKLIEGYQYGFLQPLSTTSNIHTNKFYNISLYTSDYLDRKYYVGEIQNAECISSELSESVYSEYKKRGWLDNMIDDLKRVNADNNEFTKLSAEWFANVRFKYENVILEDELVEISNDDINITAPRYKLLPKIADILFIEGNDVDTDPGNKKNTDKRKRVIHSETEFDPMHDKMQNKIFELLKLCSEYDTKKVFIERDRIDLKAKTITGDWHFFELKTDSAKMSIRKALGQILEYSHYPQMEKAKKLIVVSDSAPNSYDIQYIKFIRDKYGIPIFYRWYSFEKNILSDDF